MSVFVCTSFRTQEMEEPVFLSSSSVLYKERPKWVVYQDVYQTHKMFMRSEYLCVCVCYVVFDCHFRLYRVELDGGWELWFELYSVLLLCFILCLCVYFVLCSIVMSG